MNFKSEIMLMKAPHLKERQLFTVLGIYNFGFRRYGRNYDLFYVSTEAGRGCGGTLYNTRGVVTSPDYPRPHAQASNCEWTLKVPPGQRIQLRFASKYTIHIIQYNYTGFPMSKWIFSVVVSSYFVIVFFFMKLHSN